MIRERDRAKRKAEKDRSIWPEYKRLRNRVTSELRRAVGTNDLESDKTPKEIAKDIYDIAQSLKTNDNMVTISGLVPRGDQMLNGKVVKVNDELMEIARSSKFGFVDHSNINSENHLKGSRLHTNKRGTAIIANNFIKFLCN